MKKSVLLALSLTLAFTGAAHAQGSTSTAQTNQTTDPNAPLANSITKVVGNDTRLTKLAAALKAANLEKAFDTPGEYTVFAPTDEAFAKIPQAQLDALLASPEALFSLLTYHVVPGRVPAADVQRLQEAMTLQGDKVSVTPAGNTVRINNANIVATDVSADNGVVHLIDAVLLPTGFELPAPAANVTTAPVASNTPTTATNATNANANIAQIVSTDPRFTTLAEALQKANLLDRLTGGTFTVFAPTNDAFAKVPQDQLQAVMQDPAALERLLQYHVTQGNLSAQQALEAGNVNTLSGANVTVAGQPGAITVNGAAVTQPDVKASNGIVHVVDTVLMPPSQ